MLGRPAKGDKEGDIRAATVAEVAHVGSTAVSVNKIAKRAGVSIGTLYRFHRSKDDLLFAVFLSIKSDIHAAMMAAASREVGSAARLKAMWLALVDYGCHAPQDFQLVEIMTSETRAEISENTALWAMRTEVLDEIRRGIEDGTLVAAEVQTIETVLASPAITLARRATRAGQGPDPEEIEKIFQLVWRGIARDQQSFVGSDVPLDAR